jgi:hypothetical protein
MMTKITNKKKNPAPDSVDRRIKRRCRTLSLEYAMDIVTDRDDDEQFLNKNNHSRCKVGGDLIDPFLLESMPIKRVFVKDLEKKA